jgi:hypothetical protein
MVSTGRLTACAESNFDIYQLQQVLASRQRQMQGIYPTADQIAD